jgi:hypothetical protein
MRLETRYECYECREFRLGRDKTVIAVNDVLIDLVELECGHLRSPNLRTPMEGLGTVDDQGAFHQLTTQGVEEHVRRAWQETATKMVERGNRGA